MHHDPRHRLLPRGPRMFCFLLCVSVAFQMGLAGPADSPAGQYVKKSTWAATMLATRAKYTTWFNSQERHADLVFGTWYVTKPIPSKRFAEVLFPEKGVDFEAKGPDGKPLWKTKRAWVDGQVHKLPGSKPVATYLYRIITAKTAAIVPASLGSDDGLVVWLNGKKVLSKDVPRGVGPDQDRVKLKLAPGPNKLLMKIYNRGGGHGFYFASGKGALVKLLARVQKDFPDEIAQMEKDVSRGRCLGWFRLVDSIEVERALMSKALKAIGPFGKVIREEYDLLLAAKAPPSDLRWLELYVKTIPLRGQCLAAKRKLERFDFAALRRGMNDLMKSFPDRYTRGPEFLRRADALEKTVDDIREELGTGNPDAWARIDALLAFQQEVMLSNPLLDFGTLLFIQRRRRGGPSSDPWGLPQNWQGNSNISKNAWDNAVMSLSPVSTDGKLKAVYRPEGHKFVGDLDLNFNADRILFSSIGTQNCWQIFEMKADGTGIRQVTPGQFGEVDNYDPCYLPDGRVIFASTRCFQGVPCVGGSSPVANLFLMNNDGSGIRQLTFDQDHDWCPTVLNDGRVLYTRWEYTDSAHYFTRLLMTMNPDGSEQGAFYGSNSLWPNSTFYARPIPNQPTRVVAVISGHHGVRRMGELVIFDSSKGRHEANGVVQRIPGYRKKVEPKIADRLVDKSWPKFLHPYPLSEKYFLVSCQPSPEANWGIYLVDIFDNITLLREEPGYGLFEPIPLRKTKRPVVIPDKMRPGKRTAEVYVADIYSGPGLAGVPRGTVKKLRVYGPHYAYNRMGGHINIGIDGPWDVHRIYGTVPVEEDGSALFTVPANTPLSIQPLDGEGRALQIMRSWMTAMPGEILSCAGCHEEQNKVVPNQRTLAIRRAPSSIKPWYGPPRGFSFEREVQPVLDKYCIGCHGGEGSGPVGEVSPDYVRGSVPDFSAKAKRGWRNFTPSYIELQKYVRRPGPESDYHLQVPLEFHASTSELVQMLKTGHHGVEMDAEAWDRLLTWIDLNVPDHGSWSEERKIASDYHERRMKMFSLFANVKGDPEMLPLPEPGKISFIRPAPSKQEPGPSPVVPGWPFSPAEAASRQKAAGGKKELSLELGGGVALDLVLIPAGKFTMGDTSGRPDEWPLSPASISKPFFMGKFEVTNEQFQLFAPQHDSAYISMTNKDHSTRGYPVNGPRQPVVRVSWQQAVAFCRWLSERTGRTFHLPTEAEWEWASRAGSSAGFFYGKIDADFSLFGNMADASLKKFARRESPKWHPRDDRSNDHALVSCNVGQYRPNAWGLCDMHGNVCEWTLSLYRPYPYRPGDGRNDLKAPGRRVVRGGSWYDRPKHCRSASRRAYPAWQRVYNTGFRVAMTVSRISN